MSNIFNKYDILDLALVNADLFVQRNLVFRRVCVPLWETSLSTAARFSCVCNVCPALLFLLSVQLALPFTMPCVWRYCSLLHYSSPISSSPIAQQMCSTVNSHLCHNPCIRNPIFTIMGVLTLYNHTYLQQYVWFPNYTSLRLSTYVKIRDWWFLVVLVFLSPV